MNRYMQCREAGIYRIAGHIAYNAGLTGKGNVIPDGNMSRTTGLAGKDNVISHLGTAGNACLCNDEAVFTDFHIVTQMDEVVYFRTSTDLRAA